MPQPIDPGFKSIVQVAIVVKDIESAARHWSTLLGVPFPEIRATKPGEQCRVVFRGKPSTAQVKLCFFDTGTCILELLQPVGPDSSWHQFLDEHGQGVQHIAFKVQDLGKSIAELTRQGFPPFHSGRYDDDSGSYTYMDSEEKLGVTVELLNNDKPQK